MNSLFNMPSLGIGFQQAVNGLLGQGSGNDMLGGVSTGLQGRLGFFSGGNDVAIAIYLQQASPQAAYVASAVSGPSGGALGNFGVGSSVGGRGGVAGGTGIKAR